jgi:hypothetical protein
VKARSTDARLRRAKWQVTSGKYQEKEWRKPMLILGTCYLKPETLRARARGVRSPNIWSRKAHAFRRGFFARGVREIFIAK